MRLNTTASVGPLYWAEEFQGYMTTKPSTKDWEESCRHVPPLATLQEPTFFPQIRPKALRPNPLTYKMSTRVKFSKWVSCLLIEYICHELCRGLPSPVENLASQLHEPGQPAWSCWNFGVWHFKHWWGGLLLAHLFCFLLFLWRFSDKIN